MPSPQVFGRVADAIQAAADAAQATLAEHGETTPAGHVARIALRAAYMDGAALRHAVALRTTGQLGPLYRADTILKDLASRYADA